MQSALWRRRQIKCKYCLIPSYTHELPPGQEPIGHELASPHGAALLSHDC